MCLTCGCRRVWDDHGDPRNLTLPVLQDAALAASIPLELAAQNLQQATSQQDPARAFLAQLTKPRIVCDIDGTLGERDLATVLVINAKFGTDYHYDDVTSLKPEKWIEDRNAAEWYEGSRHDENFLANLSPYQDAMWALWSLRQGGYHVTIASDRDAELEGVSRDWLEQWGIDYDDIAIGNGRKLGIAESASPDDPVVFFDDNPKRAKDLPGPGRTVYLLDRPWNQDLEPLPGVIRVATWPQILADFPAVGVRPAKADPSSDLKAAGIAVKADETGRVLMLQRSLSDEDDPAAGAWEFPGGCLEDGEDPFEAARREWQEEVGVRLPPGEIAGEWTSLDGVYRCFVWVIASEDDVPLNLSSGERHVLNPDDPDGDEIEVVAWWDPDHLPAMPALRPEVRETTDWPLLVAA